MLGGQLSLVTQRNQIATQGGAEKGKSGARGPWGL